MVDRHRLAAAVIGDADDVAAAFDGDGLGAVISSSRALTYTTEGDDFAQAARQAASEMRDAINLELGL